MGKKMNKCTNGVQRTVEKLCFLRSLRKIVCQPGQLWYETIVQQHMYHLGLLPHLFADSLSLLNAAIQGSPDSRPIKRQVHQRPQDIHSLLKAQIIIFMSLEVLQPALTSICLAL